MQRGRFRKEALSDFAGNRGGTADFQARPLIGGWAFLVCGALVTAEFHGGARRLHRETRRTRLLLLRVSPCNLCEAPWPICSVAGIVDYKSCGPAHLQGRSNMTAQLYYDDAYTQEFAASVTEVLSDEAGIRVALTQTAFYPGGGGQPNDLGWLTLGGAQYRGREGEKGGRAYLALAWWRRPVSPSDWRRNPGADRLGAALPS